MSSLLQGGSGPLDTLSLLASQIGFTRWAPLSRDALILYPEVRAMCRADRCRNYGHSWSCPPACGSLNALRENLSLYSAGILVQSTARPADPLDPAALRAAEDAHKKRFDTLVRQARRLWPDCLPLGSGGCRRCHQCTYPGRPCRHPDKLYPSMEAAGLWVSDVCSRSGLGYFYGSGTITYTAAVLLKENHLQRNEDAL